MKKLVFTFTVLLVSFSLLAQEKYSEKGIASFYADKFDGRTTASGEIFRNSELTAAHRTLAFGTNVRVRNLHNQKTVIVKINDRGPYAHGRIIDLSKSAAIKIGMIEKGLADVYIEVIDPNIEPNEREVVHNNSNDFTVMSIWGTQRNAPVYGVQLASFNTEEAAINFGKEAYDKGIELPLIRIHKEKNKSFYRVMAGDFNNKEEADRYKKELKKMGYQGFVKTYK